MQQLEQWLAPFDRLPLECDGLTRCISTLMQRDGIDHQIVVGSLDIPGAGTIPHHWWIALPDGQVCDFRARMWLGDDPSVPHGVFIPEAHHGYKGDELAPAMVRLKPVIFTVLAGEPMERFAAFGTEPVSDLEL
jgi:hypothetical protein